MPTRKQQLFDLNRSKRTQPSAKGHRKGKKFGPQLDESFNKNQSGSETGDESGSLVDDQSVGHDDSNPDLTDFNLSGTDSDSNLSQTEDNLPELSGFRAEAIAQVGGGMDTYMEPATEFVYRYDNFRRVPVDPDGNCFYSTIAYFTDPHNTARQIRDCIYDFYKNCNNTAVNDYLGKESLTYANDENIRDDTIWASENEIIAASTLFQRPIYVFRPPRVGAPRHCYEISKAVPFFTTAPIWTVMGQPELPIVIRCSHPTGGHFEPLALKRVSVAKSPMKSPMPKIRRFDERSPAKSPHKSVAQDPRLLQSTRRLRAEIEKNTLRTEKEKMQKSIADLQSKLEQLQQKERAASSYSASNSVQELVSLKYQLLKRIDDLEQEAKKRAQLRYEVVALDGDNPQLIKVRPVTSKGAYRQFRYIPRVHLHPSQASAETAEQRVSILDSVVEALSGTPMTEEKAELVSLYLRKQPQILDELSSPDQPMPLFSRKLSRSQTFGIKSDLNLSTSQMNLLRKKLNCFGLNPFASDRQCRKEMRERQVETEMEEVMIPMKETRNGKPVEVNRWCIRAPKLVPYVKEMYKRTMESNSWVDDDRFGKKIWLAFGADAGGGTTKIVFCFGNVEKPSSANNLHILAVYEGDDSAENVGRVLSVYDKELKDLADLKFETPCIMRQNPTGSSDDSSEEETGTTQSGSEWPLKLLLFGDLKFLCSFMGHIGATATSPCLYCKVPKAKLRKFGPGSFAEQFEYRKLSEWDAILADPDAMQQYSIRRKPIWPFLIHHIIPPVLHLMLGIGTDLANKIEAICYQRDLNLGADENALKRFKDLGKKLTVKKAEYDEVSLQLQQARQILDAITSEIQTKSKGRREKARNQSNKDCSAVFCIANRATFMGKLITWAKCDKCKAWFHLECCLIISSDERESIVSAGHKHWECPKCEKKHVSEKTLLADAKKFEENLVTEEAKLKSELETIATELERSEEVIKEKKGHCTASFANALDKLGINRQAYQSGTFVGNHVHKMLTGTGPETLTECLKSQVPNEQMEHDIFEQLLRSLGVVVGIMGKAGFLSDEDINILDRSCWRVGHIYEQFAYKDATITPKMHILVKHVPDFAKTHKTVGLISEHGLESIHNRLNRLSRRFACVRSITRRMHYMVREMQIQNAPSRMREKVVEEVISKVD